MSTHPFPNVTPNATKVDLRSNTTSFISPLTGAVKTASRGGERLGMSLTFTNLYDADRRALMSFVSKMNGMENRVALRDHSYTGPTGALTSTELIDLTFNATNWYANNTDRATTSNLSQGIRLTTSGVNPTSVWVVADGGVDGIDGSALVNGVAYSWTVHVGDSRSSYEGGTLPRTRLLVFESSAIYDPNIAPIDGVKTAQRISMTHIATDTSFLPRIQYNSYNDATYGTSQDIYSISLARCLLVDNGVNYLTYSEQFNDASWTKSGSTISANPSPGANAPDGTDTADELVEDSTPSAGHSIYKNYTRTSAAEFWTGFISIKENTNQRIRLFVHDGAGNGATQFFDANTGTMTSTATLSGSGADLPFASIHDDGNGWYVCRLTVYLPATTTASISVHLCDGASNTISYNGDGSSGLYVWGAGLIPSHQLGRYTETTSAVVTGTDQTGSQIWVKGLDSNVDQQLLAGDQVEINGQLCILQSDLDGDAYGCGLMEIRPGLRTAPTDGDPVILYQPHGTFLLMDDGAWSNRPGAASRSAFSDMTLNFVEDIV